MKISYKVITAISVFVLIALSVTFDVTAQDRNSQRRKVGPALQAGERFFNISGGVWQSGALEYGVTTGVSVTRYQSIQLPAKARMRRLDLVCYDNMGAFDLTLEIISYNAAGTETSLFSVSSSGSSSSSTRRTFFSSRADIKLVGDRVYMLKLTIPAGSDKDELKFAFARIVIAG